MTTTFENARVGDRVWCILRDEEEIRELRKGGYERWGGDTYRYPIHVSSPSGECETNTACGLYNEDDITQSLFLDKIVFEAPARPLPKLAVDAKVIVWSNPEQKYNRHFSHFENGRIYTFDAGTTSFSKPHEVSTSGWTNWELAE